MTDEELEVLLYALLGAEVSMNVYWRGLEDSYAARVIVHEINRLLEERSTPELLETVEAHWAGIEHARQELSKVLPWFGVSAYNKATNRLTLVEARRA